MTLFSISTDTLQTKNLPIIGLAAILIASASFYAPILSAAPIYKVIDKQTGQVIFTDNPQKYAQQADKQVSQTNIMTGNSSVGNLNIANNTVNNTANSNLTNTTNNSQTANNPQAIVLPKPIINYQLTITEPSAERAYRRPAQSIDVQVQIRPALQAPDSVSIYLDDNEVAQGLTASIATVDLTPGEHTIQVMIKNQEGKTLQHISRTVYVIQNTQALQNKKKLAAQQLAYDNLSWYQKVLLKMRQNENTP